MKSASFVFAISYLLCVNSTNAQSLTRIYELSINNNFNLKAAKSQMYAGLEREKTARSQILPQISLQSEYQTGNATSYAKSSNIFAFNTEEIRDIKSRAWQIQLSQSLFDAPAYYNYQSGKETTALARLQYQKEQQHLIYEVIRTYLNVANAAKHFAISQNTTNAFASHVDRFKNRLELGLEIPSDFKAAQAALDVSASELILNENNLNVAFYSLTVLTGQVHEKVYGLQNEFQLPDAFRGLPHIALPADNLDLKLAQTKANETKQRYYARKSKHLPTLTANVRYADSESEREFIYTYPDTLYQDGFSVSLNLSVPIYSGGRDSSETRAAFNELQRQKYQLKHLERQLLTNLKSGLSNLSTLEAAIEARKTSIKSLESALSFADDAYVRGVGDFNDVLEAQEQLYVERKGYSDLLLQHILTLLDLKLLLGSLSVEDIYAVDGLLDKKHLITPNKQYSVHYSATGSNNFSQGTRAYK